MTPKEKAKELVEKFYKFMYPFHPTVANKQAKECALIAVDEILKVMLPISAMGVKYWETVKEEINKL